MLDERVKTLHPKIHGGLLADRGKDSHLADLERHEIAAVRSRRLEPLPVPRTAGHRHDRHRRPGDGARGGEEPRVGHGRHEPRAVRARSSTSCARNDGTVERGDATRVRARSVRAHGRVRRRDRAVAAGRRVAPAASGRRARTLRRDAALRREPAPAQRRATAGAGRTSWWDTVHAARRARAVVPQLLRHRRGVAARARPRRRPGVRDHQAREPVRRRGRERRSPTRTNARSSATSVPRSAASSR